RHFDEAGEIPAVSHCLASCEAALGTALDDRCGALPIVRGLRPIALPEREPGEVVEGGGDGRVLGAEGLFVDRKGAFEQPPGLGVAGLAVLGPARLLRSVATEGCSAPRAFSSMARARLNSGSASA